MKEHVHFIGIGGTGLSAIAKVLLERGYRVSGSDQKYSPLAQAVEQAGGQVMIGHQAKNVQGADVVVRSSAVPDHNVEVQAALEAGIPVLKRADFLGRLMENKLSIAIAGTHGKTTTTSMVAWILSALGEDPTFIVGGVVQNLGTNAKAGRGPAFVIEADEYDYMFLGLSPQIAVVANVEHDHPDIFPTPEAVQDAFLQFVGRLNPSGVLLFCADDKGAAQIARAVNEEQKKFSYGISASNLYYRAGQLRINKHGGFTFDLYQASNEQPVATNIELTVPGKHNVQNALAALAVADQLGLSLPDAAQALTEFQGSRRRFDVRGEFAGVTIIDDYAHHPTAIQATLAAAREKYPQRTIWAVWQPHTFSRTRTLFERFTKAFEDADQVIVTKVFPSREPIPSDFSAQEIVDAIEYPPAHFLPELESVTEFLIEHLSSGDVLLVLTAGNAIQVSEQLAKYFEQESFDR
ncbi:MAG: UDP-N-acetylmuramate--L-alanine ligase [Chloroflexota bacterium]|nr:MAG: UDP-N-acetylmuramate--L-alanine ligase [Chloroflexota bacterium]